MARLNSTGINSRGEICGVTTTAMSWKFRTLGDSPILGAGLYVDGQVGAADQPVARSESLRPSSSSCREMRRGAHPGAGMEALRRIKANTVEKRLLNSKGTPNFYVNFYILNAPASMRRDHVSGVECEVCYLQ